MISRTILIEKYPYRIVFALVIHISKAPYQQPAQLTRFIKCHRKDCLFALFVNIYANTDTIRSSSNKPADKELRYTEGT